MIGTSPADCHCHLDLWRDRMTDDAPAHRLQTIPGQGAENRNPLQDPQVAKLGLTESVRQLRLGDAGALACFHQRGRQR